jgi:hypothetical protein
LLGGLFGRHGGWLEAVGGGCSVWYEDLRC